MIDHAELKARVYFGLKTNSLTPIGWEQVICHAMGATWVDGDKYLADGILENHILNIKTRKKDPTDFKRKENQDFLSDPARYKPHYQEFTQRRTNLPVTLDEQLNTPEEIGAATLQGFEDFVQESYDKFPGTNNVLDVIVRHGINRTHTHFLVDIDIFNHHFYNPTELEWCEVLGGNDSRQRGKRIAIDGYKDGVHVVRRNGSNSGIEQTCYKIYKDLTTCDINHTVSIPLPKKIEFNREEILKEIENNSI